MTETTPAVFCIAQDLLNHAKALHGEGTYRWHCGTWARQLLFEAGISITLTTEISPGRVLDGDFMLCGLDGFCSVYVPSTRLELHRLDQNRFHRIALIEFPGHPRL